MRVRTAFVITAVTSMLLLGVAGALVAQEATAPAQEVEVVARVKPILEIDGLQFKDLNANGRLDAYEDWRLPVEERVENLLFLMSIEEKAGMMLHPNCEVPLDGTVADEPVCSPSRWGGGMRCTLDPHTFILERHITHMLNNGVAPPATFAAWSNGVQEIAESSRLGIPILFSSDPRHGATLGAHVSGTQYFSQWPSREGQYGIAASRDLELCEEFGRVTAEEYRAVGLHMILGPQIDVTTEPRWGRDAGCFSESADLTSEMIEAFARGCQGETIGSDSAMCMVKHWPGSGPHDDGNKDDLVYPGDNMDYHLQPFVAAFEAGVYSTMSYYSTVPFDGTVGASYSKTLNTDILRDQLGFEGYICTDWGVLQFGAHGVEDLSTEERWAVAIESGVNQFGMESDPATIVSLVESGRISEELIDESVRLLLTEQFKLGLFDNPYVDPAAAATIVRSAENQALGYQAQLESIVMLTNNGTLPMPEAVLDDGQARRTKVFVVGIDPIQAGYYATVVEDPAEADLAILRVAATESGGGYGAPQAAEVDISFPEETLALVQTVVDAGVPTVVALNLSGTLAVLPQELFDITDVAFMLFDVLDTALFDVIFGRFNPVGKLPFELPSSMDAVRAQLEDVPFDSENPLFEYGHGLSY